MNLSNEWKELIRENIDEIEGEIYLACEAVDSAEEDQYNDCVEAVILHQDGTLERVVKQQSEILPGEKQGSCMELARISPDDFKLDLHTKGIKSITVNEVEESIVNNRMSRILKMVSI